MLMKMIFEHVNQWFIISTIVRNWYNKAVQLIDMPSKLTFLMRPILKLMLIFFFQKKKRNDDVHFLVSVFQNPTAQPKMHHLANM